VTFTLKVTKGPGLGSEFPTDAAEARLGRTADNDIVVKDSGASRSHARVFEKGGKFFCEDMKSANGTKVNASVLNGAVKELASGDTITIGEVVFTFMLPEKVHTDVNPAIADSETVLKNPPPDNETVLKAPAAALDVTAEVPALDPNATMLKPPPNFDQEKAKPTRRSAPVQDDSETKPPSQSPLARRSSNVSLNPPSDNATAEVPAPLVRRGAKGAKDEEEEVELTAADKARVRRNAQKSTAGKVGYAWSQLGKPARIVTGIVGAVFVLGIGGLLIAAVVPRSKKPLPPEPTEILGGAPTIQATFGWGDGVMYERPDMKIFTFSAASATQIVGVLHYQAGDITKDEVSIALNSVDLGFVPADTLDVMSRELEVVLPAQQVKKNEENQIVFDNVKNPPGKEPWRIWNLWLELIAIPDMTPEETLNAVREDLERSQKFYEQRDIGPENLFKAWKGYREAWLKMESMPARPEDLYVNARQQQREIRVMLDKRCSAMELDVQKALALRKPDRRRAREVLEEMLRYFPTREHPCNGLARAELEEFGVNK
jgi:pSer/pThr/pTyr-binding forkhead associated (FHA) protein